MESIFDLVTVPWTPDILDEQLRRMVWQANCSGFLASELPKSFRGREDPPEEFTEHGTPVQVLKGQHAKG